ncbi:MAG TPA: DNA polymerase IV [Solirubrobacterales bacterium]|nr:DNA polymerase IV [Solirubrobacterales bacterium]
MAGRRRCVAYLLGVSIQDWTRVVAHLDMDAFYASVELLKQPELKGKPVVVCGSGPRAVVTTASYEARRLAGIHSAMPAATARRRLPDAVYIKPDFPAYREASAQVMDVLRRNAETVEVMGLDEAYLDLSGIYSPKATMRRIAAQIREQTGLTCSVGISESRMLAKITSELGKPAGLVVLSREAALERFALESPGLIPGIGPKTVQRLERMGISTLAELWGPERGELEAAFGPRSGAWLYARGRLWDETPVTVVRETKSQSTEITFDADVGQREEMERHLVELGEELCRRLAKRDLAGRTIGIKIRLDDWTNVTRSHTVEEPTNDPEVVVPLALELLRAYDPQRPVRLLGVRLASFENETDAEDGAGEGPQMRLTLPAS